MKTSQTLTELKQENKKLRQEIQTQHEFLATSTHDLRTPLTTALLAVQMLKNSKEPQKNKMYFEYLESSLNRLQELTDTFFEIQKYELGLVELQREKIDLNSFLTEIHARYSSLLSEKSLVFSFENKIKTKKVFIKIDQSRIQQVLENLIGNAIKFVPKKSKIILRTGILDNQVRICVIDSGCGIPTEEKKKIFQKFISNDKNKKGAGLGLHICKKIIELHKGKIWCENNSKGKGAVFCILLPVK